MVILVVVLAVIALKIRDNFEKETAGTSGEAETEQTQVEEKVIEGATVPEEEEETVIEKKAIQYDGGSPNEFNYLTGVVNYAGLNGDKVMIRVSIDQYLEEGECELVLVQDGEVIYQETVEIMGDATSSTCKGFDVPTAGLISSGELQFTVYLNSGERVGEISGGMEL